MGKKSIPSPVEAPYDSEESDGTSSSNEGPFDIEKTVSGEDYNTFTDHRGLEAVSASLGERAEAGRAVLPPKAAVQVYVTYDKAADLTAIGKVILDTFSNAMEYSYCLRLEIYAAERASIEECMRLYHAERSSCQDSWRAFQLTPQGSNYMIYIDSASWRTDGVTLVAWDDGQPRDVTQSGVKSDAKSVPMVAAEDGFLYEETEGNLGDALVSFYNRGNDTSEYWTALSYGKESWDE